MKEREADMNQELIVLVDNQGNPIGTAPKLESHNENTPLHLAFSCFVFNDKGEFLLTQRAKSKKVFPGIWTNSLCGHPMPGEKTPDAIHRRLHEELGLTADDIQVALPDFRYKAEMNGIVENEICPVYVTQVTQDPKPNPEEVEDYKWIVWSDFLKEIESNPKGYSVWSVEETKQLKNNPAIEKFTT